MKFIKRFWVYGLLLIVILAAPTLWRQYELAANANTPAGTLAADMAFTNKAKLIFYNAKPVSEAKADFQKSCPASAATPELGCYVSGRIYYMTIERAEFKPEMEVTATHEMLHAAYDNLSNSDQAAVNTMVEAAAKTLNDPDLNATLALYAKTEPGERDNELHSILGTEYAKLPPDLEAYYSRYFTNRKLVVEAHKIFHDAIAEHSSVLNQELAGLNAQKASLLNFRNRMNYLATTGQIDAFNSQVDSFNASVKAYNAAVASYNADVAAANAVLGSIDSTQLPSYTEVQAK